MRAQGAGAGASGHHKIEYVLQATAMAEAALRNGDLAGAEVECAPKVLELVLQASIKLSMCAGDSDGGGGPAERGPGGGGGEVRA